jgi:hypothetical protein
MAAAMALAFLVALRAMPPGRAEQAIGEQGSGPAAVAATTQPSSTSEATVVMLRRSGPTRPEEL